MFENVGKKIQGFAKSIFITEIVLSVISCIITLFAMILDYWDFGYICLWVIAAPVAIFVVGILAWIQVVFIYGFGKLIEDVGAIRSSLSHPKKGSVDKSPVQPHAPAMPHAPAQPHAPGIPEQEFDNHVILN